MKIHMTIKTVLLILIANHYAFSQGYQLWTNYKEIVVTSQSTGLTNYQVKLIIYYESEMKSDFSDIRFVNSSGNELDYWIQDYNDTSATLWVNANSISTSGTTVKMYYGNSNATDVQSPTNVFELYDGFNGNTLDQTIWSVTQQGGASYSFEDSTLKINVTQTDNFISIDSQNDYDLSQGYAFLCKTKTQTNRGHTFFGFGDGNSLERLNGGGSGQNGFGFTGGHDAPYKAKCSTDSAGISYSFGNDKINYHLIENEQDGNSIYNYYLDGTQEGSVDSTEIIDTGSRPFYLWLNGWDGNNRSAWIDYVAIRKYSNPEPTYQIGNSILNTSTNSHSLSFDGVDDDVDISLNNGDSFLNNSPGTIAFWFKMYDTSSDNTPLVVSHEYPGNNFFQFKLDYAEQKLVFLLRDDSWGAAKILNSIDVLEYNTWQFVSGTVDEDSIKYYINGVLQDSEANSGAYDFISSSNRILFAHSYRIAGGTFTNTFLDEVSIWSVALTQSEIQNNMSTSLSGNETGLVGYWNFNEGTGTTASDATSNGNNGTIYGATWSTDVPFSGTTTASALTWSVRAKASLSTYNDNDNYLGVASSATNTFDAAYDEVEPPVSPGSSISLYFPHPEWNSILGDNFSTDARPEIALTDTMQVWDFEVVSTDAGDATLTFVFSDVPSVPVILENTATGVRQTLTNNATYTFTAVADSAHPFKISIGDTTAPALALGSSCTGPAILISDSTHSLGWTSTDGYEVDSVLVSFSSDSGTTYALQAALGTVSGYSWTVPDAVVVTGGKFKIKAQDYAGNSTEKESDYVFAIAGDSLSAAVTAGWTLWGAPINPANDTMTINLDDDFTDYWDTFDYVDNGYTYNGILKEAEGYWLGAAQDATIDVIGTPIVSDFTMSLSQGWELISNPLVLDVSVDSLTFTKDATTKTHAEAVTAGWVNSIYGYSSTGYAAATTFSPWSGYWIGVLETGVDMTFPIHRHDGSGSARSREDDWMITFDAQVDGANDGTTMIGYAETATDGFDAEHDAVQPPNPPGPDYVSLFIAHPEWNYPLGDKFAKDIRATVPDDEYKEWLLSIESSESNVQLNWTLMNIPDDYEVGYTIDDGIYFNDMRSVGTINISADTEIIVRVGSQVLGIDDETIPDVYALQQNYPNPFNPITTLRYDLPEQANVNIIIYDMLGRQVRTLINQTQDAGFKSVIWNATNDYGKPVSAGVYLYQIQAGKFVQTRKMVLLK